MPKMRIVVSWISLLAVIPLGPISMQPGNPARSASVPAQAQTNERQFSPYSELDSREQSFLAPPLPRSALMDTQTLKDIQTGSTAAYVGAGIFDDRNAAWIYTGAWVADSLSGAYQSTLHTSNSIGSTASLSFNGTGFSVAYLRYPNGGNIGVYLDGRNTPLTTITTNGSVALPKYTSPTLMPGNHTVVFKHAGPDGANIGIDAIVVARAKQFYVDGAVGSNTNPGTQAYPWQTIQKAANTLSAGDRVIVAAGDYSKQRVYITRSGKAGAPILFQAQGVVITKGFNIQANYVVVRGFQIANTDYVRWYSETSAGVYIKGSNNTIENNYIHDAALNGIEIYSPASNPTVSSNNLIRNNRLYHNENIGIEVRGRSNVIIGNEVWGTVQCHPHLTAVEDVAPDNNGAKCPNYPAISSLDADGMRFFGQGHIFKKNYIHDIRIAPPESVDPHIDCFQTWSNASNEVAQNVLFEGNYCENLTAGMSVFMLAGGANHIRIQNNIFRSGRGINTVGGADYLYVYNNIWANNLALGNQGYTDAIELMGIHAIVKNNIFYNQPLGTITVSGDTSNMQIDYNLAYNSNGTVPHCIKWGQDDTCQPRPNHELWNVNPLFVDPAGGNFHLQAYSPAINRGVNDGLVVDYDGNPRPYGAAYDIGAYEYSPTASASPAKTVPSTSAPLN